MIFTWKKHAKTVAVLKCSFLECVSVAPELRHGFRELRGEIPKGKYQ